MEKITHIYRDVYATFNEVIILYFSPLIHLYKFISSIGRRIRTAVHTRNKTENVQTNSMQKDIDHNIFISKLINSNKICNMTVRYNQSACIEYATLSQAKYKSILDAIKNKRKPSFIDTKINELSKFLNNYFYDCAMNNFSLMHDYFDERHRTAPRLCIKGNIINEVVSVFRDRKVKYNSDSEINNNYGFKKISTDGKYYFENNIPKAISREKYFNQRIDLEKAQQYYSEIISSNIKPNTDISILKWASCWTAHDGDISNDLSCYQSTLILPISLWSRDLSKEFKELTGIKNEKQIIFGFLCVDHITTNFFDEDFDPSLGNVFANNLATHLYIRFAYTRAIEKIKNRISEDSENEESSILNELPKPDLMFSHNYDSLKIKEHSELFSEESKDNRLFVMDKPLYRNSKTYQKNSINHET